VNDHLARLHALDWLRLGGGARDLGDQGRQKYHRGLHVSEGSLARLKSALAEMMQADPKVEAPAESPVSEPAESSELNATIKKGPIYLVCWSSPPNLASGSIGPFSVAE